jgi:hypothetical protein
VKVFVTTRLVWARPPEPALVLGVFSDEDLGRKAAERDAGRELHWVREASEPLELQVYKDPDKFQGVTLRYTVMAYNLDNSEG